MIEFIWESRFREYVVVFAEIFIMFWCFWCGRWSRDDLRVCWRWSFILICGNRLKIIWGILVKGAIAIVAGLSLW